MKYYVQLPSGDLEELTFNDVFDSDPEQPFLVLSHRESLKFLHPDHYTDASGKSHRLLAMDLADTLTPEEAQKLYRFAVLVTKLCRPEQED